MSKQRKIDGNLALNPKQKVVVIEASKQAQTARLRVAAYCRVSSSSEDQLKSFAAQNRYYTALIAGKENWELVDIYADAGITGTSSEKRTEFQRLLSDCRRGLIDRVLCKSISRFARNTTDCLAATRELKSLGVGVCFEEENIDTSKLSGEMLTAVFAALAQAGSKSISDNQRMGIQMRMKNGTFIPATQPYGYRRAVKEITIYEPEAQQVRQIFMDYLSGYNAREIAERLNLNRSAETPREWTYKAIVKILRNEKYTGNSVWQKSYHTDTLPRKERKNYGEREQYYAPDTHPPLVSQDIYQRVQKLLEERKEKYFGPRDQQVFPAPGVIYCGHCGVHTRRKTINGKVYHICRNHDINRTLCPLKQIPEAEIQTAFPCVAFQV